MHEKSAASIAGHPAGIAFLFPGQGSNLLSMGRELAKSGRVARRVFEQASDVLGWPLIQAFENGSGSDMGEGTRHQPALLALSYSALRLLQDSMPLEPDACLGHSLGEYSALVAAGCLSFEDGLKCVEERARLIAEAMDDGAGGMAAVISLERDCVEEICAESAGEDVLEVANLNAPDQIVISGHKAAMDRAKPRIMKAGARAFIRLKVDAPFHSPLMRPVVGRLADVLERVEFSAPACPVLSNVTGLPHQEPDSIRRRLAEQVASPVRWEDCVRWVLGKGVRRFVELGPGGVLGGLLRSIDRGSSCIGLDEKGAISDVQATFSREALQ